MIGFYLHVRTKFKAEECTTKNAILRRKNSKGMYKVFDQLVKFISLAKKISFREVMGAMRNN